MIHLQLRQQHLRPAVGLRPVQVWRGVQAAVEQWWILQTQKQQLDLVEIDMSYGRL